MRNLFISYLLFAFISCDNAQSTLVASDSQGVGDQSAPAVPIFTNTTACTLAAISYCSNPQAQMDKYLPGWKVIWHPVPVSGNHAFVATNGATYAVAIRGSLMEFSWDAFDNWIYQDLNIVTQQRWPYCDDTDARLSQGSYRGWENLDRMVDTVSGKNLYGFLAQNIGAGKEIVFTGHSLGGNLATVYASYYASKLRAAGKSTSHLNVISFAAPAAGNKAFATAFNKNFPLSVRIENSNDIVAKFPCAGKVSALGKSGPVFPDATAIMVGYQNMSVTLSSVFQTLGTAMTMLEFKNGLSNFTQTNGEGTIIQVKASGKNTSNDVQSWFAEAGYQHGIAQYAMALGAPVVECR